ncbi:stage II sporulation protein E [Cohnella nanjingensis]|uniref:Stage II sporulation protein E n=1 Tax=Cohnella nanjingensis TaxID=1387779 RepID=A0A7X0RLC4_9BACL|nr:stage II sporulation protein E [Cohnella nanjingensis]MBB6669575.1 stage II sporulation protein E [Cohnella nanjingensis]
MDKPSVIPFVPRPGQSGQQQAPSGKRRGRPWFAKRRARRANEERPPQPEAVREGRWVAWQRSIREYQWLAMVLIVGFLLGRASMLEGIAPFAAAYFGVMLYLRREQAFWAALALIGGSFWAAHPTPLVIVAEIGVIYLLYRGLEAYERADLSHAPVVVFSADLLVRLFHTMMMDKTDWLPYVLTAVEAGLALVLTLLFVHAVPILAKPSRSVRLRHEEWIGLMILLASIMTGFVGWTVYGVATAAVLTRYIVLLFAMSAGPALGTSAGVVAGIILSLSDLGAVPQISLLAFGGLLAGLLREGGKAAAVFGLLLGTSVLALYTGSSADTMASAWASVAASLLLFVTPRAWTDSIAKYVPGTSNYAQNQQEYAQKVRDLTAARVERFSEVFRQLSTSFRQLTQAGETARQNQDFNHFINAVHERNCGTCHKRGQCWDGQFFQTYKLMTDLMTAVEEQPEMTAGSVPKTWHRQCVKIPQVLDTLKRQYELYRHDLHWRTQLQDSRLLVADQLSGVSQVMDDLVREIRREAQEQSHHEEQIRDALDRLGLAIQHIDIISLEEGHIEIEMVHAFRPGFDECRKIVAPLLSDILGEAVSVRHERSHEQGGHLTSVTFASAKAYEVETGVAGAAKDGDLLSGDSFSMIELGNGKFAVALSDGMGNGSRARMESSAALSMLEQLLQSGIDEQLAIKSVNSVLLLRSPEEMFATVDLALIDLYSAHATMLKIGSTPSFIKRGREVIPIAANNLPIGILQDIEIDVLRVQLQPGDTLVMMTDGILDSPGHAVHAMNKELWMKRVLQEIDGDDSQELADSLLDTALRQFPGGDIRDDMTVIVTRISKHQPEWATFRWPGLSRLERPRTVS